MQITKSQIGELFQDGLNCSQIVFSQFCERYHIGKEDAFRIGCGFGGGARAGEICGAVSGAIMVIGLKYGNTHVEDVISKNTCYEKTKDFIAEFRKQNSSIVCRELLECDISTDEGMQKAKDAQLFQTRCVAYVESAIQVLETLGY